MTNNFTLLCLFIVLFSLPKAKCQVIGRADSIKLRLNQEKVDSVKASQYHELAKTYIYSQPDSSFYFNSIALQLAKTSNDAALQAEIHNSVGSTHYVKGEYDKALEKYLQYKNIYDSLGQEDKLGLAFNNIGLIYLALHDYSRAVFTYKKAIAINQKYANSEWLIKNHYNIGICYLSLDLIDSARINFNKSITLAQKKNNQTFIAKNYAFLGELNLRINLLDSAENFYLRGLDLFEGNNDWDICFSKAGYAKVLLKKGDFKESMRYAEESLLLAQKLDAKWEMERIYQIIAEIHEKEGNYAASLDAYKKHKQFGDSIFNFEKENSIYKLNLANQELENDKLLIDNLMQQQKLNEKNIALIIILAIIVLLAVIIIFIYNGYRQKISFSEKLIEINQQLEEKNKDLEIANATKNKLFSIVSHDLVGPIASLRMMVDLTKDKSISPPEFESAIDRLSKSIDNVNFTLTNLLYWAKSQMLGRPATAKPFNLEKVVVDTLVLLKPKIDECSINIIKEVPSWLMIHGDENEVQLVIRNLISNSIKFTPKDGVVSITAKKYAEDLVEITINDTGVGMDNDRLASLFSYKGKPSSQGLHGETGTGLGLMLCYEVITANGGTINVDSRLGKGTTIRFTLPSSI